MGRHIRAGGACGGWGGEKKTRLWVSRRRKIFPLIKSSVPFASVNFHILFWSCKWLLVTCRSTLLKKKKKKVFNLGFQDQIKLVAWLISILKGKLLTATKKQKGTGLWFTQEGARLILDLSGLISPPRPNRHFSTRRINTIHLPLSPFCVRRRTRVIGVRR